MEKIFKDYRQESMKNWGVELSEKETIGREQLLLGAALRIADATEKIATNYNMLQSERDQYKRWYENEKKDNERMARSIAALKGVITKLKKCVIKLFMPAIFFLISCNLARNLEVTPPAGAIREQMLVTLRPMGFAFSRYGLTVIRGDTCTHYDCSGQLLKPPIKVWLCDHQLKNSKNNICQPLTNCSQTLSPAAMEQNGHRLTVSIK